MTHGPDDETPQLWERQAGESARAFAAFSTYRDLGPNRRGIRDTARLVGKSVTQVGRWSRDYGWVNRVSVWDAHVDFVARQEQINNRREMVGFHADLARQVLLKVEERILGSATVTAIDPNDLSPTDIVRWLEVSVKLERLSRGVPAEVAEQQPNATQQLVSSDWQLIMADQELATKAEDLAIEIAKAKLRKEARGD